MAHYPIVGKHDRPVALDGLRQLPAFYMEDFSVLGFRVNNCDRAVRILDQHAFTLKRTAKTVEVNVQPAARIQEVMQLLNDNGLECEIADVAEGMYQG
jgi:hypothetical protein